MDAYGIIRNFVFVALIVATTIQCVQIHDQMTDDEIANLFHTTRDNLPEYEVVPIRHNRHRRSERKLRLQFTALGKEINAYLKPSEGKLAGRNTPVWLATVNSDGTIEYNRTRRDIVGLIAEFFDRPSDLSSVVLSQPDGDDNPSFEGMVDDVRIRPLPARLQQGLRFKRKVSNMSEPLIETNFHVVFKPTLTEEEQKLKEVDRQIREASAKKRNSSKSKRSSQNIIYPSILINTDYKGSRKLNYDLLYYDEIMYQLAFWNAVDLRFRQVENPKIRLRISGIIIGVDRAATPYMNDHRDGEVINMSKAWDAMQTYWGQMTKRNPEFPTDAYDIIVTMTNYRMTLTNKDGSATELLGVARVRGLCLEPWGDKYYATAVVKDKEGFDGVITAAHELGHIMSLDHDKDSGDECDKSHGFIMQPKSIIGPKNLEWSSCSLKSISYFLRKEYVNCVDRPAETHHPGPAVARFLPAFLVNNDKQCQSRGFSWACDPRPGMCEDMWCYHSGWAGLKYGWWCQSSGPAAEGTVCAPDHKCINGKCQCMSKDCMYEEVKKDEFDLDI